MASKKKVARKPQVWNKGLEVGKRDGFTPAQVKRFAAFSRIVVSPGSEIWLSSRRQLIPCCTDRTCSLLLLGKCSIAMVQSVPSLKLRARGESHRCDAPCPPQRRLQNGSPRPAKRLVRQKACRLFIPRRCLGQSSNERAAIEPSVEVVGGRGRIRSPGLWRKSLRRTKALHILKGTGDLQTVRALLGHATIESTARYLGLTTKADPITVCRAFDI